VRATATYYHRSFEHTKMNMFASFHVGIVQLWRILLRFCIHQDTYRGHCRRVETDVVYIDNMSRMNLLGISFETTILYAASHTAMVLTTNTTDDSPRPVI
jgi:hypothetical protein